MLRTAYSHCSIEKRNLIDSLSKNGSYLSAQESADSDGDSTIEDGVVDYEESQRSFMNGKNKVLMHTSNLFQSRRIATSFMEENDIEVAPSQLLHNVALVTDPNLIHGEQGKLFYSLNSFYNTSEPPEYALTVSDTIYTRLLQEINDSKNVPCGLYFFCNGGESGSSHDDFVSIQLAWTVVGIISFGMLLAALY